MISIKLLLAGLALVIGGSIASTTGAQQVSKTVTIEILVELHALSDSEAHHLMILCESQLATAAHCHRLNDHFRITSNLLIDQDSSDEAVRQHLRGWLSEAEVTSLKDCDFDITRSANGNVSLVVKVD